MLRNLLLTIFAVLVTVSYCASLMAQVDCSLLDPRASVSIEREGKIRVAADTLFKIGKAGGSIEGRVKDEIRNIEKGAPVTEQGVIKLRTLYVFCGMVANAKDLSTERKVELYKVMMDVGKATDKPKSKQPSSQTKKPPRPDVNKAIGASQSDKSGKTSHLNPPQINNISIASQGQIGGITAQNVTVNIMEPKATDSKPVLFRMNDPSLMFVRKYIIPKNIGTNFTVGECPSSPCFYAELTELHAQWEVDTEGNRKAPYVVFSLGGMWDGISGSRALAQGVILKEGCGARISTGYYDFLFEVISDRTTTLEVWAAVLNGTLEKGQTRMQGICP